MEYAESPWEFPGRADVFRVFDEPLHGREVFSLVQESELGADEYVTRFCSTGPERAGALERCLVGKPGGPPAGIPPLVPGIYRSPLVRGAREILVSGRTEKTGHRMCGPARPGRPGFTPHCPSF